jgi:hypothetical protein
MAKEFVVDKHLVDRLEAQLGKLRTMAPNPALWDRTAIGKLYALVIQHNAKKNNQAKKANEVALNQRRRFFGSRTAGRRSEDE